MPRHLTDKEAKSGKLFEVVIASGGCMLMSRKVFEKVLQFNNVGEKEGQI